MSFHESILGRLSTLSLNLPYVVLYLTLGWLFYGILLAIYRLYICPQARFPGPRLAALTYWYEYYYDVHLEGKFIFHIIDLHQKYGPVVRINPYEIHISDPDFFSEIYHNSKWITHRDRFYNLDFIGEGLAFTCDHNVHRSRREALSPYFSMQSIRALEPRITVVVKNMVTRLRRAAERGEVLNMYEFGSAFAMDVITEYAFGKQGTDDLMLKDEMGRVWTDLTRSSIKVNPFARQFKGITKALMRIPSTIMARLNEQMAERIQFVEGMERQVKRIMEERTDKQAVKTPASDRTLFHELLDSTHLSTNDKSLQRLTDEANMVKLRKELNAAIPNPDVMPSIADLQTLPYLSAVVEEGVRISFPVPARSPRVFQDHALQYDKWTIEPGVAVSTSPYVVSINERAFPEPFAFKPERWLGPAGKELQKYAVTFGKGRRSCVGKNLAYAELWYCIAIAIRRFDMQLFETTDVDVTVEHDFFIFFPSESSKGVRVKVVKELA